MRARSCCGEFGTLSELFLGGGSGGDAEMYLKRDNQTKLLKKHSIFKYFMR